MGSRTVNIIDVIKASGTTPIESQSVVIYRQVYDYNTLPNEAHITKRMLTNSGAVVYPFELYLPAGSSEWYVLGGTDLAQINALVKRPVFQALKVESIVDDEIVKCKQTFDTIAEYEGTPGAFTKITIYLPGTANDGTGTSLDNTLIQFSA